MLSARLCSHAYWACLFDYVGVLFLVFFFFLFRDCSESRSERLTLRASKDSGTLLSTSGEHFQPKQFIDCGGLCATRLCLLPTQASVFNASPCGSLESSAEMECTCDPLMTHICTKTRHIRVPASLKVGQYIFTWLVSQSIYFDWCLVARGGCRRVTKYWKYVQWPRQRLLDEKWSVELVWLLNNPGQRHQAPGYETDLISAQMWQWKHLQKVESSLLRIKSWLLLSQITAWPNVCG